MAFIFNSDENEQFIIMPSCKKNKASQCKYQIIYPSKNRLNFIFKKTKKTKKKQQ